MMGHDGRYLCVLYVATAGQQGPGLGSDEEEVVLLIYVIIDVKLNKVAGAQQYVLRPNVADLNETVLSEHVLQHSTLTEELVRSNGVPLATALAQFDEYLRSLQLPDRAPQFCLVTDGQLPLRQCLHPESCSKGIDLAPYYNTFHDLRKDFRAFYGAPDSVNSVRDMISYLGMSFDTDNEFYVKEAKDMVNIVHRLIADRYFFDSPETVELRLEPGICSKNEEVDNNCVVRARGLPWQSSDQDIAKFFRGLNVAKGGVALCLSPAGRRNGEALVRFVNQEHRDMALKRHKHHIGNRYIEIYKASGSEFVGVAGGNNTEAEAFLSRGAQVIIRMRGLPYECTAKQVLEFFESGAENSCQVMDGEDGVLFVKKPDKRATGDAFVLFAHEEDSTKALSKHRELIGSRYIELFRSTTAEVQQVLNRSMDPIPQPQAPPQAPLSLPMLPQQYITPGNRKDCIRLRGLPYEAQVEHILEFLGEHAKSIVYQGVHMVYNAQGQPSGEAFIQMDSETSAGLAAQQKHHRYMIFGKKQRYIEVFQCSCEDMNLVLTGGIPTGGPVSPAKAAAATLLSPGMLAFPPPAPPPSGTGVLGPPPPTLSLPPAPVLTWDQAMFPSPQHMLAQAQMQALRQQQVQQQVQQQDNLWLVNQLALVQAQQQQQQQQQQLAVAIAAANNAANSKANPVWDNSQRALIPISAVSSSASVSTPGSSSFSLANSNSVPQSVSVSKGSVMTMGSMPMSYYPQYLLNAGPSLAQSQAGAATSRMPQFHPKVPPPPVPSAAQSPASQSLMPSAASATLMGIKRSWDSAFPGDGSTPAVKRQWQPPQTAQAPTALSYLQSPLPPYQAQFYPTL